MAYDKNFRESVLGFISKGRSIREASEVFSISTSTIMSWRKLRRETGQLEKRPLERKRKKIDPDKLLAYYDENPEGYVGHPANKCEAFMTRVIFLKQLNILAAP